MLPSERALICQDAKLVWAAELREIRFVFTNPLAMK